MSVAQRVGLAVLVLVVGGLAGWFIKPPPLDLTDSPVRVVGGSITARSRGANWIPNIADCASSPCYQSGATVMLNNIRLILTGQLQPLTPAQNWMIEVFDRNQGSPATNGIKFCSLKTCVTTGTISGAL